MKTKLIVANIISFFLFLSLADNTQALSAVIRPGRKLDVFGLTTYAGASITAGLEIAEDVREIGHGMQISTIDGSFLSHVT